MESFYVTSTHLDIAMATEPHPSGLVIFSRELSTNGEPTGHIIISPENHHTDIYCDHLERNKALVAERERWGIKNRQGKIVNYFVRTEPAYGIYIPQLDDMPDYPELLIACTKNKKAKRLAHQELRVDSTQVKLATQALGIVMADLDILHSADGKTRLMHFSKDQLDEQQITVC
ncbi:hypothetical protein LRM44_02925 [Candidatus Nanosynbacter sp. HMT-352]|uniref:hypothetical protein n=1 Tax=Candidatus Nanosynbacter sp. HMT-352 TaxID=2899133 RepID=UPI001FB6D54B|nr:hypothetical protein [Candidatus Nanosynbacter sp. HMT-352]UOG66225.1 hypothetical protein LRM44_02925 [Candidatus Nanosynbacter sp. HMT-352]